MEATAQIQSQAVLEWVRPPQQARTRAALTRLLDAAETLLSQQGFDEMGIAELAKKAGTSVGGFYRRFGDKERLLHALHERFSEDARATTDEALSPEKWSGAPLAEILESITAFLVEIYREREGLFRAFLVRSVTDRAVRERTERLFAYMADRMSALLNERRNEIAHPDPDTAAAFGLRVVIGTLNETIQLGPNALDFDDARLSRELARVFTGYLGVHGQSR